MPEKQAYWKQQQQQQKPLSFKTSIEEKELVISCVISEDTSIQKRLS